MSISAESRKRYLCWQCHTQFDDGLLQHCPLCNGVLEVVRAPTRPNLERQRGDIWDFAGCLPVQAPDRYVTLGEGWTPLVDVPRLADQVGLNHVFLKVEITNPTGTFKDRGLAVAMAYAKEHGARTVIGASSGNALHAQAAYAACAGLNSLILAPRTVPLPRLAQPLACGSRIAIVDGDFSLAYNLVEKLSRMDGAYNVCTTYASPMVTEGYKTIAYEIQAQMGRAPDWVVVPVGAGPLLAGCGRGFAEMLETGLASQFPGLLAVQAEACAPIAMAFEAGESEVKAWDGSFTTVARGIADALRGYAQDGTYTLSWIYRSKGYAVTVPDSAILADVDTIARTTGIYVEPTSASAVAGLRQTVKRGVIKKDASVVCILTGSGFKESVEAGTIAEKVPVFDSHDIAAISKWFNISQ